MRPAWSILLFTTLSGVGQGMVLFAALLHWAEVPLRAGLLLQLLACALCFLFAGLGASFFHLGHKRRAWRAVCMWRTSWMSREVIVMPALMAVVALGCALQWQAPAGAHPVWAMSALVGTLLLWHCTAMIYASVRFIQEWAHPLTVLNFMLMGACSGGSWVCAWMGEGLRSRAMAWLAPTVFLVTLLAWGVRWASALRNARLRSRSTLQSATGIANATLRQASMGFTAGAFNTREFFHGASTQTVRQVTWLAFGGVFAAPIALQAVMALGLCSPAAWWGVVAVQALGLLAERWLFFAQARHPQNLYYQTVA